MDLKCLVEMSNRYGSDEEFVLAGGGNTSYKENGVLYVKDREFSCLISKPSNLLLWISVNF